MLLIQPRLGKEIIEYSSPDLVSYMVTSGWTCQRLRRNLSYCLMCLSILWEKGRGGDSAFEDGRYLLFFWAISAEMHFFYLVCLMFSPMFHRTVLSVILLPSRILLVQATGQQSRQKYLMQLIKLNCPFLGLAIFNGIMLQKEYPCLHACSNGHVWMAYGVQGQKETCWLRSCRICIICLCWKCCLL